MTAISRRSFLVSSGATLAGLSLSRLAFAAPPAVSAQASPAPPDYTKWQDVYRERWRWDKIVHSSHDCNCTHSCSWKIYVKDGIVWREEQTANMVQGVEGLPDFNPNGCQKGAAFSDQMYYPGRPLHPMKRIGKRGSRQWQRISWDQALTEIATKLIEVLRDDGHDTVVSFSATHGGAYGKSGVGKDRFITKIGGVEVDPFGDIGDAYGGAIATTGRLFHDGGSDTRMYSKCVINWVYNPACTRIADAHFINEARYNGATIISISPDQNPTHMHADMWVNPKIGTDVGLALGMASVIVRDRLYDEAHMKEQTDLPFLVRQDTSKFLRGSDLEADGSDEVFFVWDARTGKAVAAPGTMGSPDKTLRLGNVDPALEGQWDVQLRDGRMVQVRPVFERLKDLLAQNTPEFASRVSGVGADMIERIAREYATRKPALITWGWGIGKLYWGDNLQRAIILLSALTGNTGQLGGGFWGGGLHGSDGAFRAFGEFDQSRTVPGAPWLYVHGGLREFESEWVPTPGKKTGDDYIMEAIDKGWMPVYPAPDKEPRVLIECGSNLLRRTRGNHILQKNLWPKLKLIVTVDFRMSSSGMQSDYVLPTAGYYETSGLKYSDSKNVYHTLKDKAVDPVGDSLDQFTIFARLSKKIQELAPKMGFTKYRDELFGVDHDLVRLYDDYTGNGSWSEELDDDVFLDRFLKADTTMGGATLEDFKKQGAIPWSTSGVPQSATSEYKPGEPFTPCQNYTERKMPWETLTGRQQFYIDHDWFLEFGEELPVHRDPIKQGGDYPLRVTFGHARWSIHSMWRDNPLMLRLQRGEPIMYINAKDAAARGINDNDVVEVFNDVGDFRVKVLVTPSMQRGQVHLYHAWEKFQYRNEKSHAAICASQVNPLLMVGNYGHLRYTPSGYQPNNNDKGATVEVRKVSA
jgi:DMSO reductase family type II enzyme molybdopterin subunit